MLVHRHEKFIIEKKLAPENQIFAHLSSSDLLEKMEQEAPYNVYMKKGDWNIDVSAVTCSATLVR